MVKTIFEQYSSFTGQFTNLAKAEIFFPISTPRNVISTISGYFNMKIEDFSFKYLSTMIAPRILRAHSLDFVFAKIKAKTRVTASGLDLHFDFFAGAPRPLEAPNFAVRPPPPSASISEFSNRRRSSVLQRISCPAEGVHNLARAMQPTSDGWQPAKQPSDDDDDDDDGDYEETGERNRLFGFMFGNVDNSGDLDADYLDEDAKEHLSALADKLGPSLTDIELIKSSPVPSDASSEQDYDEKAEDAIDYEDIDEQYDGPEVEAATEEDHLLPKKEYFSSSSMLASLEQKTSVFDEENYDEDEEVVKEHEIVDDQIETGMSTSSDMQMDRMITEAENRHPQQTTTAEQSDFASVEGIPTDDNLASDVSSEEEVDAFEMDEIEQQPITEQEKLESHGDTSLPVLCVEDGMVILRFSEIFGIHEPVRRPERKSNQKRPIERLRILDVADIVEEDEEVFLRSSCRDSYNAKNADHVDFDGFTEEEVSGVEEKPKDLCLCAQPMKDDVSTNKFAGKYPVCPDLYPFDQHDWEDDIVWGNSPETSHGCSGCCVASEPDLEENNVVESEGFMLRSDETLERDVSMPKDPLLGQSFDSRHLSVSRYSQSCDMDYLQPSNNSESVSKRDLVCSTEIMTDNKPEGICKTGGLGRLNKLSLLNKELLDGSWLDHIIWDSDEGIPKPKLILDLQDDQMLFEILDSTANDHLCSHAGAMVISHSSHSFVEDALDLHSQGMASAGRFNISNDKYYSNRKTSQQTKSHAKKRTLTSIKVMHSVPALKLQTMKPKLSYKEIANFHRPKALWYPHDNEVAAKVQGAPCSKGTMNVILMSLGGKAIKLLVNAEETVSSAKLRASKKLDFRPSEQIKVFYSGRELEDDKTLAAQDVRPNSVLHLMRTRIYLWPKAQKLPGENRPLRPPGAFKKKSELSVKDGHVFLLEYCEERPLFLGNVGMGARLCTYYQKSSPGDQTAASLRNGNNGLGSVLTLDPADKSPFLGDLGPGCSLSCLETNMYRAPIFPHKLSSTDFLLVRSAKGMLSLRRIDKLYAVGQQEPHMEVLSPGAKNVQTYLVNRMLVYVYREFRAKEKPGIIPYIRADELSAQFPGLTDAFVRKRLKHCADLKKGANGHLLWVRKGDFRIPSEEELRRMLSPENVCSYESMQAGLYRLKQLGISKLTHPVGLSTAMNQLPDEAIALAAASHIERELQITSWNLTSNFVACTNQDRDNIERLEITGVGDPSGRGLGFSYVRVTPKAPISSAISKKKAAAARGSSTVTGTDADLRRLSMDAAREVLLKFNVPEEQIDKLTRWHRIAMVRKLSSEQAAAGVKVDATALNKFARGQRMSFLQLQQQTREKCQEIWDRQVQSLSAADGDENDSDTEANSDLDSFAGDLENLLDAEECEDEDDGNTEMRSEKIDGVKGLKMRRCPSQTQTEAEIEDDKAEAAMIHRLLEDDGAEIKKKKKKSAGKEVGGSSNLVPENADSAKRTSIGVGQTINALHSDGSFISKDMLREHKEVEKFHLERNSFGKIKPKKGIGVSEDASAGLIKRKVAAAKDGVKVFKEKKQGDKPVRESFVCGACGQLGHMRTNKNCPKYGEEPETSELESGTVKASHSDIASQFHVKTPSKKTMSNVLAKASEVEAAEKIEKVGLKMQGKIIPVKFKCGPSDKPAEKNLSADHSFNKRNTDVDFETKPTVKINKIIISNKKKAEDSQQEKPKHSVVIRPPIDTEKDQPRTKIIFKQPKVNTTIEPPRQLFDTDLDYDFRKTKKIAELASFEKQKKPEKQWFAEEPSNRYRSYDRSLEEEEKRRSKDRTRRRQEDERRMLEERQQLFESRRYEEAVRTEDSKKANKKKKKKAKPDFRDEYLLETRPYRNDRRIPERDRAAKRRAMVEPGQMEYAPSVKRRRGGEVQLANVLESILETLKENREVSYLFLKPVTKKEAPDYFDIIKHPMDLSTIRDKIRNMEYKTRLEFRHDVWQITINAHRYNDGRNPGIPPLADQLLELCDYCLSERHEELSDAEAGI
ncbi:transcription initiation factor TFIID subunit 1 [Canna indica]|uniref:Transcription initiation factor TFIID subunit 1 n=1 Tax=Canna indica TaxID=4628 RepID=A0AAQ3QNN7_9LILI|nr:transcription initiation factor TFIID subunit 1 [Canna indica]